MDFKDYYEILGVAPNAEKKAIQQTFRKLARKYHPDVNPGNKEGEVRIPTLEKRLTLTIPSRTNANRVFRIRGKGMPHLGDSKKRGDLFARVRLVLPDPLTDQEVNSIRALAASRAGQIPHEAKA